MLQHFGELLPGHNTPHCDAIMPRRSQSGRYSVDFTLATIIALWAASPAVNKCFGKRACCVAQELDEAEMEALLSAFISV